MSANTPIGEFFLAQLVPEMFLGIELRGIGRQPVEADVLRDHQGLGDRGTRPVDDHDDEVVRVGAAHLGQKLAHQFGVHFPTDHPIKLAFHRTDRAVDIGEFALVAVRHHGPLRHRCPAAPHSHPAPEAGFVLEH